MVWCAFYANFCVCFLLFYLVCNCKYIVSFAARGAGCRVFGQLCCTQRVSLASKPSVASDLDTCCMSCKMRWGGGRSNCSIIAVVRHIFCCCCCWMRDKWHGFPCHLAMFTNVYRNLFGLSSVCCLICVLFWCVFEMWWSFERRLHFGIDSALLYFCYEMSFGRFKRF